MEIASFFSGAGGLDQGFKVANFQTKFANEFDNLISPTYLRNHGKVEFSSKSIVDLSGRDIPAVEGIIGGPPCQSWSAAGARGGLADPRGKLFFKYLELIKEVKPKFFVAENVAGLLAPRNAEALKSLTEGMVQAGYNLSYGILNAADFGVPQDRKRVIFVGIRSDLGAWFKAPEKVPGIKTIRTALQGLDFGLPSPVFANGDNTSSESVEGGNHYFASSHFSPIFMSRNRVRDWDRPSFTIQATASHVPLHPAAPEMVKVGVDRFVFKSGFESAYRRFSVREVARLQDFPDSYEFNYSSVGTGYKMIGNAVPVGLAEAIAKTIRLSLNQSYVPDQVPNDSIFRY
jgi:DNA (cytosine-5)-methyltransferase 1